MRHIIRERKGVKQKCKPQERVPWAPKFEERKTKPEIRSDAPAEKHGNWRKMSTQKGGKDALFEARRARIRNRLQSVNAHAEQKGFKLRRTGDSSKIQEPHNGGDSQWRSATNEESQENVQELHPFVTAQLLEVTPAVLSLQKLCECI